jgi:hypothetical protein
MASAPFQDVNATPSFAVWERQQYMDPQLWNVPGSKKQEARTDFPNVAGSSEAAASLVGMAADISMSAMEAAWSGAQNPYQQPGGSLSLIRDPFPAQFPSRQDRETDNVWLA